MIRRAPEYPDVSFNPFLIQKLRTLFRCVEAHGSPTMQVDNFIDIATDVVANTPKMSDYKGDQLIQATVDLWYGYVCTHQEETARTMAHMNEASFIENLQKIYNTKFKENFHSLLIVPFFNAVASNEDGKITSLEFLTVMKAWRAAEKNCEVIFKTFDKDNDGKITLDEYHSIWAQYFFSEDAKTPTSKMWGNLVRYKRPEDFNKVECSPFWEGKMRTMFRRFAVTGSSILRCHDLIRIARGIVQRSHLTKKKSDAVMRAMLNLWVKFIAVDKEGRHFAEISEKEFIQNMRALVNSDFRHEMDQFGWTFFKSTETEDSGYISSQQYRSLQEAWNVSREEADAMFKVIDTDKDGKISSDEYMTAFLDYFLGEDHNSPFRSFFGPIIARNNEF
jgi:Ca2+-binding EF-hand superfamily protein